MNGGCATGDVMEEEASDMLSHKIAIANCVGRGPFSCFRILFAL